MNGFPFHMRMKMDFTETLVVLSSGKKDSRPSNILSNLRGLYPNGWGRAPDGDKRRVL